MHLFEFPSLRFPIFSSQLSLSLCPFLSTLSVLQPGVTEPTHVRCTNYDIRSPAPDDICCDDDDDENATA